MRVPLQRVSLLSIEKVNAMKKKAMLFCLLGLGISIISCSKKDGDDGPTDEEILTQKDRRRYSAEVPGFVEKSSASISTWAPILADGKALTP